VATIPYPAPSNASVSAVMRANKRENTRPEVAVRSILHRQGHRFRKHIRIDAGEVRVRPDVAFTRQKLAVFIDGCFWHGCPDHGNAPRANATYWRWKLARNKSRDIRVDTALRQAGWTVLRLWEHVPAEEAAEVVVSHLGNAARTETPS
jgi:DNA mismatch endonuclease (patch repair protein)